MLSALLVKPGEIQWLANFDIKMLASKCSICYEYTQGCGLRKITRSLKVLNYEILGAQHLRLYEKCKFFQSPKGKSNSPAALQRDKEDEWMSDWVISLHTLQTYDTRAWLSCQSHVALFSTRVTNLLFVDKFYAQQAISPFATRESFRQALSAIKGVSIMC